MDFRSGKGTLQQVVKEGVVESRRGEGMIDRRIEWGERTKGDGEIHQKAAQREMGVYLGKEKTQGDNGQREIRGRRVMREGWTEGWKRIGLEVRMKGRMKIMKEGGKIKLQEYAMAKRREIDMDRTDQKGKIMRKMNEEIGEEMIFEKSVQKKIGNGPKVGMGRTGVAGICMVVNAEGERKNQERGKVVRKEVGREERMIGMNRINEVGTDMMTNQEEENIKMEKGRIGRGIKERGKEKIAILRKGERRCVKSF